MSMAKTKYYVEDTDPSIELSEDDVLLYAEQIGIDSSHEQHLMWIAEEGLSAKVPEPWSILSDENERIYYYNGDTGESLWNHPLDKKYARLVHEERANSKSLTSTCSDLGFESKLSSLADAPPLSSGGKDTLSSLKPMKTKNETVASKKPELGGFENRRGTQLTPVKLNSLKMPSPAKQQKPSVTSFMPKGSSLRSNIRRVQEDPMRVEEAFMERVKEKVTFAKDIMDSDKSEGSSNYSYEDEDSYEDNLPIDNNKLEPSYVYSTDGSPEPGDVDSLVKLGGRTQSKFDIPKQLPKMSLANSSDFHPLSRRKEGQFEQPILKPLDRNVKSSIAPKKKKQMKKDEIRVIVKDGRISGESVPRKELDSEDIRVTKTDQSEDEELELRKFYEEKINKVKSELRKRLEDEEKAAKESIEAVKQSNKEKLSKEEQKFKAELETVTKSMQSEIEMKQKDIKEKRAELEQQGEKAMKDLQSSHELNMKNVKEAHKVELEMMQDAQQKKIKEINVLNPVSEEKGQSSTMQDNLQSSLEDMKKLIKDSEVKYQDLKNQISSLNTEIEKATKVKENLQRDLAAEESTLSKFKEKHEVAQNDFEALQEETDKVENDIDLLRSEKSALFSELNMLKENVKNEKCTLGSMQKNKLQPPKDKVDASCQSTQTVIARKDMSCQISNMLVCGKDTACQTAHCTKLTIEASSQCEQTRSFNKSCQVEIGSSSEGLNQREKLKEPTVNENNMEKSLWDFKARIDNRMQVMEQNLKSFQEILNSTNHAQSTQAINDISQNYTHPETSHLHMNNNTFQQTPTKHSLPTNSMSHHCSNSVSSHCGCELSGLNSCTILRDVKDSIYNMSHILNQSFATSSFLNGLPPVIPSYTSPLQDFYLQCRNFKEKRSLEDLRRKCETEVMKVSSGHQSTPTQDTSRKTALEKELTTHNPVTSTPSFVPQNLEEDPIVRARSMVLRERAKLWKQRQELMSSSIIEDAINEGSFPSSQNYKFQSVHSSNISTTFNFMPSFDTSFSSGPDAKSDYDLWMDRLNTLQQRLRSHKLV